MRMISRFWHICLFLLVFIFFTRGVYKLYTYAIDNKTSDLAQSLDFFELFEGNPWKTEETTSKHLGTPGSEFLLTVILFGTIWCIWQGDH